MNLPCTCANLLPRPEYYGHSGTTDGHNDVPVVSAGSAAFRKINLRVKMPAVLWTEGVAAFVGLRRGRPRTAGTRILSRGEKDCQRCGSIHLWG
jgi:hypothetical protein